MPPEKPESLVKLPEDKPARRKSKATPPSEPKEEKYLINWKEAATSIETELRNRNWNSFQQRRNPRFLQGLVMKYIVGPLVTAIYKSAKGE